MRCSGFAVATVLVSLLAVSQARYFQGEDFSAEEGEVAPYSIIDSVIKAILDGLRPKLANIKIQDIDQVINNPSFNATIKVNDIVVKNADKFVIKALKSSVVPMKLCNLTLTWEEMTGAAIYDFDSSTKIGDKGPFNVFAKGEAKAALNGIFITVGANMELKDKAIQIKPKGIFGFDINVKKANVVISSLMGSTDLGNAVGSLVSRIIPDLVDTLERPLFDAFHDNIVKFINQVLKNKPNSFFDDEEPDLPEDFSEQLGQFFSHPLDFASEDIENEF